MHIIRFNLKRISLWILASVQVMVLISYFYYQFGVTHQTPVTKITFVKSNNIEEDYSLQPTYHTIKNNIILRSVRTKLNFADFNSSLCFINGSDLQSMKSYKGLNWECHCLPGWHGNDCGQPEVLWRAVLTSKRPIKFKGPRTFQRRLIYMFKVDQFSEHIADIRINDLGSIVDLFVLYENESSDYLHRKLKNNYWKEHYSKVLYIRDDGQNLWKKLKLCVKNLRNDDIVLANDVYEIPNKDALFFLKFYDHWPQPIRFRLRWSVFGFFLLHPDQTKLSGGACTVAFLKEKFDNNLERLMYSNTFNGLLLGDLNHYGGWYCEYCNNPQEIAEFLISKGTKIVNKVGVDVDYVKDLISTWIYVDSRTQLKKARRYKDNYFAPTFVLEHDWRYDFLLLNLYQKSDYGDDDLYG